MKIVPAESLVVFTLAERQFALGISSVERIIRAVEITPMPGAPAGVGGTINVEGRVVPVFDLRTRFGLAAREVRASDHIVLVRAAHRTVAVLVDAVVGVVPQNQTAITPEAEAPPDRVEIPGTATFGNGICFIHDLDRCLALEDERALDAALKG